MKKTEFIKKGDGHVDITLSRALNIGGTETTTLRMREPEVRDQLAASQHSENAAEREVFMFATLCGVAPDDLHNLKVRDYGRLQDAYTGFID